jgi:MoxR-like ATPase
MSEGRATIENQTYDLPRPFLVLATQNPLEHHGTYPLPESQLDRFLMRIRMGYPSVDEEKQILRQQTRQHPMESVLPLMSADDVLDLQEEVRQVRMDEALLDYLMEIINATRHSEKLELGVSPRGALALYRAAQALALTEEREYCLADDIKRLVVPVCGHRIVVSARYASRLRHGEEAEEILTEIVNSTRVPL